MRYVLLALLLLVPRTVFAQFEDGKLLHALIVSGIVLQGADTYLTIKSRTTPGLHEANLVLAGPLKHHPAVVVGVKAGATVATAYLLKKVHAENPVLAVVVAGAITAGSGWVVGHDIHEFRKAGHPVF